MLPRDPSGEVAFLPAASPSTRRPVCFVTAQQQKRHVGAQKCMLHPMPAPQRGDTSEIYELKT